MILTSNVRHKGKKQPLRYFPPPFKKGPILENVILLHTTALKLKLQNVRTVKNARF